MYIVRVLLLVNIFVCASGCALNPYLVEDPTTILGVGPKVADVVKSLRCEIVTFLVVNKLRESIWDSHLKVIKAESRLAAAEKEDRVEALRRIPYLDIDPT